LNLEGNGIESWDELAGFKHLKDFTHLIVNKNKIREIYYKPGFRGLKYLSFDDNLIESWKTFDALNEFDRRIEEIRCNGNPITTDLDTENKRCKQIAISRIESLRKYNGTKIEEHERKDFELFYMKICYEVYLKEVLVVKDEKDRKVESIDDPEMAAYMAEFHPRFYEFVHKFGSPLDMVNLKSEGKNIGSHAAKVELCNEVEGINGKKLTKKLIL